MEGEEGNVKVVGYWVSMYVHRVRWALRFKGVPYQYVEEDLFNRGPILSTLNPVYGKVPVLVHAGKPLPESKIILQYIDDVWNHAPSLLSADPYDRAQAHFWAKFVDDKVPESIWHFLYAKSGSRRRETAVKTMMDVMEKLEQKLVEEGKGFFGGDTIGFLDLVMGFISYLMPAWERVAGEKVLDAVKFPALVAWTDKFVNHPVVKGEYMPSMDEMVSFYADRHQEYIARFGEESG